MSWQDVNPEDLAELGFASYRDYLTSDYWRNIRVRVLDRDGWKCRYCLGPADQVRHLEYTIYVLRGEHMGQLTSICSQCHLIYA